MTRLLLALALAVPQTSATGKEKIGWDQAATDLVTAQNYKADVEIDGAIAAPSVTIACVGAASPFVCTTPFPSMTLGKHTIRVRVVETLGTTPFYSEWSDPWDVTIRVAPPTPLNLRVIIGG